jgi:CheY-like chemotaxis protein
MKLEPDVQDLSVENFGVEFPVYVQLEGGLTEMLKAAVRIAQSGKKSEAKRIFLYVANSEPNNEAAWLWLASLSEYPEELLCFLKNALRINPNNQKALEWQKNTRALLARTFVQRGIVAYKEEKKALARQFFEEAIKNDGENELAWLWLASVTEGIERKKACLEKVLEINPNNEIAKSSLEAIKRQVARDLLKKANVAFISGKNAEARKILDELMSFDSEIEEAWLLKAYLSESFDGKRICFEKVLSLNPQNEIARTGLEALKDIQRFDEKVSEDNPSGEGAPSEVTTHSQQCESAIAFDEAKVLVEAEKGPQTPLFQERTTESGERQLTENKVFSVGLHDDVLEVGQSNYALEDRQAQEQGFVHQRGEVLQKDSSLSEVSEAIGFETLRESDAEKTPLEERGIILPEAVGVEFTEATLKAKTEFEEYETKAESRITETGLETEIRSEVSVPLTIEVEEAGTSTATVAEEIKAETSMDDRQVLQGLKPAEVGEGTKREDEVTEGPGKFVESKEVEAGEAEIEKVEARKVGAKEGEGLRETQVDVGEATIETTQRELEKTEASLSQKVEKQKDGGKVILIVDDSPTIRKLISIKLEKSGYKVMQANDGIEALAIIKKVVPDLILLDITMPNLDGYQVCKMIRSNESTKDVPVVIISGKDGFFDKVRGQMAGSTGYITKPFGPETLMSVIKTYLKD